MQNQMPNNTIATEFISVPTCTVGPVCINFNEGSINVDVPLSTFETPLFASVNRGAKISKLINGINVTLIKSCMTRSITMQAKNASHAQKVSTFLLTQVSQMQAEISKSSKYTTLQDLHTHIVGNLLYIRFSFDTSDASGHNMSTNASQVIVDWLLRQDPTLRYVSISGNFCTDKKVSAVNSILGRGKHVVAEGVISREICERYLRTTPEAMVDLNNKKNLIGSIISGSTCSANAHFANILLATYLATGQDCANIVEGSQGVTFAEVVDGGLYFSITCPNIIVGTIGNGKHLDFARQNIAHLGCDGEGGANKLAKIIAATVWCGEISLLAAITNNGELTKSHTILERNNINNNANRN